MRKPSSPTSATSPAANSNSRPNSVAQSDNHDEEPLEEWGNRFLFFNAMPSWMVSFLTHIAVIVVLAIIILPGKPPELVYDLVETNAAPDDSICMPSDFPTCPEDEDILKSNLADDISDSLADFATPISVNLPEPNFDDLLPVDDKGMLPSEGEGEPSGGGDGDEIGGRPDGSGDAPNTPPGTEDAVKLALKWLVDHQLPDGGWNMDHTVGPGNHRGSPDPGAASDARAGATALALLPLLGHGNTHQVGTYKREVEAGLKFLMKRGKPSGRGISYLEPGGTMYSHGLVAIVFCEAYAMSKDRYLQPFAQGTIWFIEDAQDPNGGGWRYQPRQPGDTSVVGWQLMALKSAKLSGLDINPKTLKGVEKFLDHVSINSGAFYGYTDPPNGPVADARTAVGLLCRMYMGWQKDSPALGDGVAALMKKGPDTAKGSNIYYNYYATQVIKHIDGRDWRQWEPKIRKLLVESQEKAGVMAGSWTPGNGHAEARGGRLYTTSLSCMTLEVYYRYLPLYGKSASSGEFPLK